MMLREPQVSVAERSSLLKSASFCADEPICYS